MFGYTFAALVNNQIHMRFGRRGIVTIAPICRFISYVVCCVHPPFAVIPVVLVLAGFGNGLEDGGYNAWVGNMNKCRLKHVKADTYMTYTSFPANELLGFLHGAYGLGAAVSPLIATSMIVTAGYPWYCFYYMMVSDHFSFVCMDILINV